MTLGPLTQMADETSDAGIEQLAASISEPEDQRLLLDCMSRVTRGERRGAVSASHVSAFGTRCVDVLWPDRPAAFEHMEPEHRASLGIVYRRIDGERQRDLMVPVLAAAQMRHSDLRPRECLVLTWVAESILRQPNQLTRSDARRLTWFAEQVFALWLRPEEVAVLLHRRWLAPLQHPEIADWWSARPDRRPLIDPEQLAVALVPHGGAE